MKALTVAVNYQSLAQTLPYNRHHFSDYMIVTTPQDTLTQTLAIKHDCQLHVTESFYANGARFNKWIAQEEGLDVLGRTGWLCMLDADIFWPRRLDWEPTDETCLYTPKRHLGFELCPEHEWGNIPLHPLNQFSGYSHIFHADSPYLGWPWYETHWLHAGGADTSFQNKWPTPQKIRPPFTVLHIGPPGLNWAGTDENSRRWLGDTLHSRQYPNPDFSNEHISRCNNSLQKRR